MELVEGLGVLGAAVATAGIKDPTLRVLAGLDESLCLAAGEN